METNNNLFYLLNEKSNLAIKGDKEAKKLTVKDITKEESYNEFVRKLNCNHDILNDFIFELLVKKIENKHRKRSVLKFHELKDLHNIITIKNDGYYYQLIVDSNNYTYDLNKYPNAIATSNSIELEDFVFDIFVEALIEAKFICTSKKIDRQIIIEGINGNLSYSAMNFLLNYPFSNGNYYDFKAIEKQFFRYYSEEISYDYFSLYCRFVSEALNKCNNTNNATISNVLDKLSDDEFQSHYIYACLRYLDFKAQNKNEDFITDGVIRIVSQTKHNENGKYYNLLVIDTNNKIYNIEKDILIEFDDNINYTFLDSDCYYDWDDDYSYYNSNAKYFYIYLSVFNALNKDIFKLDKNLF